MKSVVTKLFQNFLILEAGSGEIAQTYEDLGDKSLTIMWGNNEEQATFDIDVEPVVVGTQFTIDDRDGGTHTFKTYKETIPELK